MRRSLVVVPALLLCACQKADNQPGPGGVTVGEAKALDEAAAMIEDQRLSPQALPSASGAAPGATKPVAPAAPAS